MSDTKTKKENEKNVDHLSEKLEKLEELSKYFESDEFNIDEGIKKYEQGMKLAKEIKEVLTSYELKIKEIQESNS